MIGKPSIVEVIGERVELRILETRLSRLVRDRVRPTEKEQGFFRRRLGVGAKDAFR